MSERITFEMIKQNKDGKNITSQQTFGYKPRYRLRMVGNFYNRQLDQTVANSPTRRRRQFNPNDQFGQNNNQMNQNNQNNNQMNQNNQVIQSDLNMYEQYEQMYGKKPDYQGPPISPKLPQDELYLLNSAIILDRFELTNGIVYLIDSYPQYYDSSLYMLPKDTNTVTGLGQNIK